jgi:flagellar motor switch protein FliM
MLASDKVLSLSFEIAVLEVRGGLNLAVPISVSHTLLRKISAEQRDRRPRGRSDWRQRLKHRLLECPFAVELEVGGVKALVGELSQLQTGQLLSLGRSVAAPASLLVGGVEMFHAVPARCGDIRAAQVLAPADKPEASGAGNSLIQETKK